jgi:hypothetical protein
MHILGAIAEFERARIAERVKAGLQRARAHEAPGQAAKDSVDDGPRWCHGSRGRTDVGRLQIHRRLDHGRPVRRRKWSRATSVHRERPPRRAVSTVVAPVGEARRLQLVTINAAELVKVPKPPKRPIVPLTLDQARAFLAVAQRHAASAQWLHSRQSHRQGSHFPHSLSMCVTLRTSITGRVTPSDGADECVPAPM